MADEVVALPAPLREMLGAELAAQTKTATPHFAYHVVTPLAARVQHLRK